MFVRYILLNITAKIMIISQIQDVFFMLIDFYHHYKI